MCAEGTPQPSGKEWLAWVWRVEGSGMNDVRSQSKGTVWVVHAATVTNQWLHEKLDYMLLLLPSHFSRVQLCVTPWTGSPPWESPGTNTGVGCHFLLQCMKVKSESEVTQSCSTLVGPMDCSPSGSSIRGIFQARVLEWVAIALSIRLNEPSSSPNPHFKADHFMSSLFFVHWQICLSSIYPSDTALSNIYQPFPSKVWCWPFQFP